MARAGKPKVGLVLGAGGVLGGAWLEGALYAIASETGWDPGGADYVAGTSAGAMVGALLACGVPPWFMVARSAGEDIAGMLDVEGEPSSTADRPAAGRAGAGTSNAGRAGAGPSNAGRADVDRSDGSSFRLHRGVPVLGPGSWRLALSSLARPYKYSPAALAAGWLPRGLISTEPLKALVRRACEQPWAPHPNFWAMAVDYRTGNRVAFGRENAPPAELPDAVAASCAVPGFFRPVDITGRRYVDGGVHSASNLDVLAHEELDLVIALSPMSSLHAGAPRTLGERAAFAIRQASGRRLGGEAKRLEGVGTEVVLIQPTVNDLDVMGSNLMNRGRRNQVVETAVETVTDHLRRSAVAERLSQLPPGVPALVRRPNGRTKVDFLAGARARRAWSERSDSAKAKAA